MADCHDCTDELYRAGSVLPIRQRECVMDMLYITGLHKRFGNKAVLNGLKLAVPEHSIFGFTIKKL